MHTNTLEEKSSSLKRNVPYRNRTASLVRIDLLRYMLWRNQPTTMLKNLLYISFFLRI
ncbi:hypothetical protein AAJ76_200071620 [Vairimorpha ceranae]|uniref:Uncharacterized protein n=1 Tax=Vairimorpha ceranae TaxID=40302 RepID=A0A0F9ZGZ3_9MICR|nr:hypothetical protein AAJ76_200071620 [Vairimorpha ceranae]KKO76539.1 hypothetical protein AAJ76_200071620 [Vairimorpha ceranae]